MKIFIDSANVEEIREAKRIGVIDGVTTNPSLVARENRPFEPLIAEICEIVDGPVSAETVSPDAEGMIEEARRLSAIHPNVVVKVPMTAEGLKATTRLREEGIRTNVTLVFSPMQALLAAKAGATYISPFVGRLDDISHIGMGLIEQILQIFSHYEFESEVLVASVRNPTHVVEAAMMGAHVATLPFKVILQLMKHPLTDIGIERFLQDWERVPK
ncbi:MAG: fructose-6-phosphate aldolase [Deltaproteobacteria bacterium]|nr:MAG: fructose-6-phosphate aldolase [Deltaproteobacteria bacterium]